MPPEIIHTPTYRQSVRPSGSPLVNCLKNLGVLFETGAERHHWGAAFKRRLVRFLMADLVRLRISPLEFYRSVSYSVSSTRHLETHFCHESLGRLSRSKTYLDVSSPRAVPYFFLRSLRFEHATLCNPDVADLEHTRRSMARGSKNTTFLPVRLQEVGQGKKFDLITSVSVVEHIAPDETVDFLGHIAEHLAPGGLCLLTFPCARSEIQEYRDADPYTTQAYDVVHKNYYFQKYFTRDMVEREILPGFSEVVASRVFGEREKGLFRTYEESSVSDQSYSSYRDREIICNMFSEFQSIDDLPGVGVCCYLLKAAH